MAVSSPQDPSDGDDDPMEMGDVVGWRGGVSPSLDDPT